MMNSIKATSGNRMTQEVVDTISYPSSSSSSPSVASRLLHGLAAGALAVSMSLSVPSGENWDCLMGRGFTGSRVVARCDWSVPVA